MLSKTFVGKNEFKWKMGKVFLCVNERCKSCLQWRELFFIFSLSCDKNRHHFMDLSHVLHFDISNVL